MFKYHIALCWSFAPPILTPFLVSLLIKNEIEKAFLTLVATPPLRVSDMILEQPLTSKKYKYIRRVFISNQARIVCENGDYKEMCGVKAVANICVVLLGCYNQSFCI